jgi:serine/threonine protein kinase
MHGRLAPPHAAAADATGRHRAKADRAEARVAVCAMRAHRAQVLRNVKRRARMDSEIELLRRLSHPNVMGLRDLYESKDAALLVMGLMCGGSLRERIEQRGGVPFDERLAAHFVRQITLGLAYLHEQVGARRATRQRGNLPCDARRATRRDWQGVVHRDIKPENILLSDASLGLAANFELDPYFQLDDGCGTLEYWTRAHTPAMGCMCMMYLCNTCV